MFSLTYHVTKQPLIHNDVNEPIRICFPYKFNFKHKHSTPHHYKHKHHNIKPTIHTTKTLQTTKLASSVQYTTRFPQNTTAQYCIQCNLTHIFRQCNKRIPTRYSAPVPANWYSQTAHMLLTFCGVNRWSLYSPVVFRHIPVHCLNHKHSNI